MQQCILISFKTDKVNFEKTIGAAISDLFRKKPSSKKPSQEHVVTGSRAQMGGQDEG